MIHIRFCSILGSYVCSSACTPPFPKSYLRYICMVLHSFDSIEIVSFSWELYLFDVHPLIIATNLPFVIPHILFFICFILVFRNYWKISHVRQYILLKLLGQVHRFLFQNYFCVLMYFRLLDQHHVHDRFSLSHHLSVLLSCVRPHVYHHRTLRPFIHHHLLGHPHRLPSS